MSFASAVDIWAQVPARVSRVANADQLRKRLGLLPDYAMVRRVEDLKVAVLDSGFEGIGPDRPYLPANAVVVEHYDPAFVRAFDLGDPEFQKGFEPGNHHGREMAQIVWAVTGSRPAGPKFFLLNANGPTMLRRAICRAIVEHVDVILFSGTFEGGGNGDGHGPINRAVDEALAAGILWINAAGNYGRSVFQGPVRPLPDGQLRFKEKGDIAALRFRNHLDENTVTVTLTWNDYRDAEDAGTDKDLDLFVEDWTGRLVGSATKKQVTWERDAGPDETRNPRERLVLEDLPASPELPGRSDVAYRVRARWKAGRFTPKDRLRVLVTASKPPYVAPGGGLPRESVEFLDASRQAEIFPPADHPLVLTVGDGSPFSSIGPTTDGRPKPDTLLDDSTIYFTDGTVSGGSSNAAACFAGLVALMKAVEPGLKVSHLLWLARSEPHALTPREPRYQNALETTPPPRAVVRDTTIMDGVRPLNATSLTIFPSGRMLRSLAPETTVARVDRPVAPPPPADERSTRYARPWRTPSRSRLADIVRLGR
mgnify:CR=1 FL=1